MKKFNVYCDTGNYYGVYEGETKTEALCEMHTDAGYDVRVNEHDELVFNDPEDEELCGNVDDWVFCEFFGDEIDDENEHEERAK
jgi:hypothetical protein